MGALLTGVALFVAFQALGLGPALWLRARTALPPRYVTLLTAAATATLSYGVFWIAVVAPWVRFTANLATLGASLALAAWIWRREGRAAVASRAAWLPALLAGTLAAACIAPLYIGPALINQRFAWALPSDNILPGLFAARVVNGLGLVSPVPLWPDGDRATERPPLQAAVVVTVGTMVRGIDEYQSLATICQAQWLPALWLVGAACGLRGCRLAFVLGACALSGFFFLNTVYTWPKLFAASFMLGALAIAMEPPAEDTSANRARVIVVFALCTLALLAHPGPVFTMVAIPVCWPILRPIVRLRLAWPAIAAGAVVAAALIAPWIAYQTVVDPPTGRLLREHLADGRADGTVAHAIVAANLARPIGEQLRVRLGNVAAQLGDPTIALWPFPWQHAQHEQFFRHGASLGLLLAGLVIALVPRPQPPDPAADPVRRLAILALVALAVWSLLVFAADGAPIHHGSPMTTALLFFAGAYGLTRLPWALQLIAVGLHAIAFLLIWILPFWGIPHT